ncbi:FABP family protein [Luteimicrobium sp. NPDC057192]|uniref:FABP family protein n=1 Tax=Luteimicrobium sp. NPDC057192 TaxID=3346042 RepID=UPI0036408AC2
MPFAFPEGLAPEAYPLAWLVGRWRGEGVISYPGIDEAAFVQEVVFDHDGGPYLRYESTIRLVEPEVPATVPDEWTGEGTPDDAPTTTPAAELPVWETETGYWRVSPDRPEGLTEAQQPLEVMLADPAGWLTLYVGAVGNGRIDLVHDLIARTSSSAEITAAKRLYGLVEGDLMWVWEIAAFGHPLQNYASARLVRQDES